MAFAIESFIHSPDLPSLFAQLAKALSPGAKLIVFDDFLKRPAANIAESAILNDFRVGWKANSLCSIDEIASISGKCGLDLISDRDFTTALHLNRPRDKFVKLIVPLARPFAGKHPYATFLIGGNARQEAYKQGLLTYNQLTFVRK